LDLAALRNERRQHLDVFVADVVDLLDAEFADAPPPEKCPPPAALFLVVLLGAAASAPAVIVSHRSPLSRNPISPPVSRSSFSSRLRCSSVSVGSGGRPRRSRRATVAALRRVLARSATASSSSTRTRRWRMTTSKTRRRRSISAVIAA